MICDADTFIVLTLALLCLVLCLFARLVGQLVVPGCNSPPTPFLFSPRNGLSFGHYEEAIFLYVFWQSMKFLKPRIHSYSQFAVMLWWFILYFAQFPCWPLTFPLLSSLPTYLFFYIFIPPMFNRYKSRTQSNVS